MKLILKSFLFFLSLAFATLAQASRACKTPSLYDFSVVTLESMSSDLSDIQGSVAVGTQLNLSDYEIKGNPYICIGAAVGRGVFLERGQIFKTLEIGDSDYVSDFRFAQMNGPILSKSPLSFFQTRVLGPVTTTERVHSHFSSLSRRNRTPALTVSHDLLRLEIEKEFSKYLRPVNTAPKTQGSLHIIDSQLPEVVADITHLKLDELSTIQILAPTSQRVILIHRGVAPRLHHLNVQLVGIEPKNVFWLFPVARQLSILHTADPQWGLPGHFFAPSADLSFYEGLVTGSLFIKNWLDDGQPGKNSGQVNGIFPPKNPLN